MKDKNAGQLLAKVMEWQDQEVVSILPVLQLLADVKYDQYQRFGPGKRFIESLALWLNQFETVQERRTALDFVLNKLIFFSESELNHIVQLAYPDLIVQEQIRLVAEEQGFPLHKIKQVVSHKRFKELQRKSLYLGLSDGARTNELRRSSNGDIGNEQIWQAYELGDDKAKDMLNELQKDLAKEGLASEGQKFNLVWLLDDFSGSGNTYIRYDSDESKFKGKIKKVYDQLLKSPLIDPEHYEVFLLLYVATRQSVDHIEYWCERFTSEHGYKPLQVRVLFTIERDVSLISNCPVELKALFDNTAYYDEKASDKHIAVGGTEHARLGFANCALPVVLSHNTPNNSVYLLWGPENYSFQGLFPRVSRHKEF